MATDPLEPSYYEEQFGNRVRSVRKGPAPKGNGGGLGRVGRYLLILAIAAGVKVFILDGSRDRPRPSGSPAKPQVQFQPIDVGKLKEMEELHHTIERINKQQQPINDQVQRLLKQGDRDLEEARKRIESLQPFKQPEFKVPPIADQK